MTMGVDDGKRAKSASRRGRVSDDISPPERPGLAGVGEERGSGLLCCPLAASSSSALRLGIGKLSTLLVLFIDGEGT
jgi:hypothetical protein